MQRIHAGGDRLSDGGESSGGILSTTFNSSLYLWWFDFIVFTRGCRFNSTGASPERIVPCPIFRINYNGDLRTALGSSPFSGTQCVTGLALPFSSSFPACPFSHVRGSSLAVLIKTAQVKGGCCSKETELYICCPWRAVCSGEG